MDREKEREREPTLPRATPAYRFKVVIVGCGIAGASAAIALSMKGHDVTVLDTRAEPASTYSNGVVLFPNAVRVLERYGLLGSLMPMQTNAAGTPKFEIRTRSYSTSEVLRGKDEDDYAKYFGYPPFNITREQYLPIMVQSIVKYGGKIRLGTRIAKVEENRSGPSVLLETGERIHADVVVGADGINSITRRHVLGEKEVQNESSISIYVCRLSTSALAADPETEYFAKEQGLWVGSERMAVMAPLGDQFDIILPHYSTVGELGDWNRFGDPKTMRELYKDWHPSFRKALSMVDECKLWRLADLPPLQKWVSDGGKVVIIGDAAHAMLPYAGQGAGTGIEDGAALAEAIDRAGSPSELPLVLHVFQNLQKPRVERISHQASQIKDVAMIEDGELQELRDEMWRSETENLTRSRREGTQEADLENEESDFARMGWLLAYDVVKEAQKLLDLTLNPPSSRTPTPTGRLRINTDPAQNIYPPPTQSAYSQPAPNPYSQPYSQPQSNSYNYDSYNHAYHGTNAYGEPVSPVSPMTPESDNDSLPGSPVTEIIRTKPLDSSGLAKLSI